MSCCSTASKCFLTILGIIFWCFAATLMFIGGWIWVSYHHYDHIAQSTYTLIPATVMLGVGVFMFVMGCLACCGACKENKCILATFLILLLLILMAEVAVTVMGYVYRNDVGDALKSGIDKAMKNYDNETFFKHEMDWLQENLQCCGRNNASDWENFWHHNYTVPVSCCKKGVTMPNSTTCDTTISGPPDKWQVYQVGCYDQLKADIKKYLTYITIVCATFAIIQLVGLISSSILMCRSKEVPYLSLDRGSGGYRV